jgi:DNA-binding transcriptional regulator YdaS (Cro superfamily)
MSKKILKEVVRLAGGQVALANKIRVILPQSKVTQAFVWKWLNSPSDNTPPSEWVIPICQAIDWQSTPHELRPDIYPNPTDGLPVDQNQEAA